MLLYYYRYAWLTIDNSIHAHEVDIVAYLYSYSTNDLIELSPDLPLLTPPLFHHVVVGGGVNVTADCSG